MPNIESTLLGTHPVGDDDPLTLRIGPRASSLVKGWAVGLLAGGLLFIAVVGFVTLLDVSQQQSLHNQTLNQISALTREIRADEMALAQGNLTVAKVLREAGQISEQLLSGQAAICNATPGCHLP